MWSRLRGTAPKDIDDRLAAETGRRLKGFHVHVRELPRYRFVDFYRAAEHHGDAIGIKATLESDHRAEYLGGILHSGPPN